jgi:predicted NBD/HSP70 family sugar kinase
MGGELGHVDIVHAPFVEGWRPSCGCGQEHCAEAYMSMAALMKILPVALKRDEYKDHVLHGVTGTDEADTWRKRAFQVRGLAAKGDKLCQGIFDWQSEALGKLCRQISNVVDPSRIVIGGGFIEGGKELTDRIMGIVQDTFRKYAFKKHAADMKFEVARAGDQAGCLGAALSAWQWGRGIE